MIDASEDSQLEAAIRASLQETHYVSSNVPDIPDSPRSDEESDAEPFSDSEGPISVDGSDSETPASHDDAKSSSSKHAAVASGATALTQQRPHPDSSTSSHRKSPYKENNHTHKKEESKKNHLEPTVCTAVATPGSTAGSSHLQPDSGSGGNHCSAIAENTGPTKTTNSNSSDLDYPDDNGTTYIVNLIHIVSQCLTEHCLYTTIYLS